MQGSKRGQLRCNTRFVLRVILLVVLGGSLASCRADTAQKSVLRVYAASNNRSNSVKDSVNDEAAHPEVDVAVVFAGSQVLRLQLQQGAKADVFACANPEHTQALVEAGIVRTPRVFAYNELALIVPPDNPAGIESFVDLPRASRLVVGSDSVPVGQYTGELLRRVSRERGAAFGTQVRSSVVSKENNVRLVRAKVELGESDAAIVYRTDALSSSRVKLVEIPSKWNVRASYWTGVVTTGTSATLADQWLAFVWSEKGRSVLVQHGFKVEE